MCRQPHPVLLVWPRVQLVATAIRVRAQWLRRVLLQCTRYRSAPPLPRPRDQLPQGVGAVRRGRAVYGDTHAFVVTHRPFCRPDVACRGRNAQSDGEDLDRLRYRY